MGPSREVVGVGDYTKRTYTIHEVSTETLDSVDDCPVGDTKWETKEDSGR